MSDTNVKVLPPLTVEHYQTGNGQWYWHAKAPENGRIMADSGEGYENEQDCVNAAKRVTNLESTQVDAPTS